MRLARDEILPGGNIHIRQVVVLFHIGLCRRLDVRREDEIRRRSGRGVAARLIDAREDEHGAHDDQHRQRHRQPETFLLHADPSRIKTKPLFAQNRRRRESYLMQLSFFYFSLYARQENRLQALDFIHTAHYFLNRFPVFI